jgi:hypothetical protein
MLLCMATGCSKVCLRPLHEVPFDGPRAGGARGQTRLANTVRRPLVTAQN